VLQQGIRLALLLVAFFAPPCRFVYPQDDDAFLRRLWLGNGTALCLDADLPFRPLRGRTTQHYGDRLGPQSFGQTQLKTLPSRSEDATIRTTMSSPEIRIQHMEARSVTLPTADAPLSVTQAHVMSDTPSPPRKPRIVYIHGDGVLYWSWGWVARLCDELRTAHIE
jgi:hypothetical protein